MKKQSEKAKAFLQLSQEKRQLEVALWNLNLDQTSQKLKEQEDKILACQVEHEDLQQSSQALEEKINQSYEEMQRCLSRAEDCRQEKEELEQQNSALLSQEAVGKTTWNTSTRKPPGCPSSWKILSETSSRPDGCFKNGKGNGKTWKRLWKRPTPNWKLPEGSWRNWPNRTKAPTSSPPS